MAFITSVGDRNEVELFINGETATADVSEEERKDGPDQDLRDVLVRSRERSPDHKHRRHGRRNGSSSSSKYSRSSGSRSRFHSYSRNAKIPRVARKLPRANKFVLPKSGSKKSQKVKPTDISVDEFLAYNLRVALRLANTASGEYATCLSEYLEYQEYLVTMKCNYSDDAVLKFDDDFRRTAESDKLSLRDERCRKILADRYFHSASRKTKSEQAKTNGQLFRSKAATQPPYRKR